MISRVKSCHDKGAHLDPICVEHRNQAVAEAHLKDLYKGLQEKHAKITEEFQQRRQQIESQRQNIVSFLKTNMSSPVKLTHVKTEKLSCLMENDHEVPVKAEVYYCTSEGKVYGELTVTSHCVFFEPADTKENSHLLKKPVPPKKTFASWFKPKEELVEEPHAV
jgi:hypothetical protein